MLCGSDFPSLAIGFSNWNRRKCTYGEELYAKWLLHKHNLWSSFESVVLKRSNSMDPNFWDPAQLYSEKAPSQGWVLHHHPVSPLRAIRIACHPVDFQASPHSLTHFVCGGQSNQMIFLPFIPLFPFLSCPLGWRILFNLAWIPWLDLPRVPYLHLHICVSISTENITFLFFPILILILT